MRPFLIGVSLFLVHALLKSTMSVAFHLNTLPNTGINVISKVVIGIVLLGTLLLGIYALITSWKRNLHQNGKVKISIYFLRALSILLPIILTFISFSLKGYVLPVLFIFLFLTFSSYLISKFPEEIKQKNLIKQLAWFFMLASIVIYMDIFIKTSHSGENIQKISQKAIYVMYIFAFFGLVFGFMISFLKSDKWKEPGKSIVQYASITASAIVGGLIPSFITKAPEHIFLWAPLSLISLGLVNPYFDLTKKIGSK